MPDLLLPRLVQSDVLFYDAVNITGVQNLIFYFSGGGINVFLSNNGSVTEDNGTYEEVTSSILSGIPFSHTFASTGQVLRMRVVIDGGAKLYAPMTNGEESDYLWQGQIVRAST